jgi:hypothetical protein
MIPSKFQSNLFIKKNDENLVIVICIVISIYFYVRLRTQRIRSAFNFIMFDKGAYYEICHDYL